MPGELNLGTMYASLELRTARLEQSLAQAVSKFDSTGRQLESRAKRIQENVGRPLEELGRVMSTALAAPILGLGVAAVKAATDMDSLKRGLRAVTGSSAETERQLKQLREVAKLPGLGFKEAVQGAVNLQAAGFSAKQAQTALMSFGNALATVGKGKDALAAVNVQLTQMANKQGAIGEDIRALASWVPQLRSAMMRVFGTADTEAISKAGVTGKQVVMALSYELAKLPKVTGGIQNSFENLKDQLFISLGEVGKTLLPAVGRAVDSLTASLQGAASWWSHLSSGTQDWIVKSAGIITAFSLVTAAIGKMVSMITTAIEAAGMLKAVMIGTAIPGGGAGPAAAGGAAAGAAMRGGLLGLATRLPGAPLAAAGAAGYYSGSRLPGLMQKGQLPSGFAISPTGAMLPSFPGIAGPLLVRPVFKPFGAGIGASFAPASEADAAAIGRKIQEINILLASNPGMPDATKRKLIEDRGALVADALAHGVSLPEGTPGVPSVEPKLPAWQQRFIDNLRKRVQGVGDTKAQRKAEAAARKAAAAQRQQESNRLQILNAMGFGWQDPDQILAQYLTWQKQGTTESYLGNLGATVQGLYGTALGAFRNIASVPFTKLVSQGMAGLSGFAGRGFGMARNVAFGAVPGQMMQGLSGSLQGMFGGMMGAPASAQAAAQQELDAMKRVWEAVGRLQDEEAQKTESRFRKGFQFVPDLAMNLADEFTSSFGRGLERAFGKNPFGRAIAHSLTNMMQSILDNVFMSGVDTGGGEGGGGKDVNWGAMLGKIGLGAALSGIGSLFGGLFQEGGVVPGPAGRAKLAVVHGGEVVLNQQQQAAIGGGLTINFHGDNHFGSDYDVDRMIDRIAWRTKMRQAVNPG